MNRIGTPALTQDVQIINAYIESEFPGQALCYHSKLSKEARNGGKRFACLYYCHVTDSAEGATVARLA